MLDIFQMFWILATLRVWCLTVFRRGALLARYIVEAARQNGGVLPPMPWGLSMGLHLWRFAAGVCRCRGGCEGNSVLYCGDGSADGVLGY